MRKTFLLFTILLGACGIFSDTEQVTLRDAGQEKLDTGELVDQRQGSEDAELPRDVDMGRPPLTCGDGLLQPDEACDPLLPSDSPGACPTVCDDGLACTTDTLVGAAATCDAACAAEPIVVCQNNDGCCPSDCTPQNDTDCDDTAVCGDGVVTGAETCDPSLPPGPGFCPKNANDCEPQQCQNARVIGAPQNCDSVCAYIAITGCVSGDGCCPSGCDEANDDDCASVCGNGIIEPGEGCDGNCPVDCDDGDACTINELTGAAATCDAVCNATEVTACIDDDGCCPAGCTSATDNDCSGTCGDGVIDANETCDPPGTCPTNCDDSNPCTVDTMTGSASNCNAVCTHTPISTCRAVPDGCCPASCNANNDSDCAATCGNGVVETGEACDGNCPTTCDDGNVCTQDVTTGTPAECSRVCTNTTITVCTHGDGCCPPGCNAINDNDCGSVCGNAITEPGEQCDGNCPPTCNDGNACTIDIRSGSSAQCNVTCSYANVTSCVSGDGCCPSACNANNDSDCSPTCGNGIVEGNETCDGDCPSADDCYAINPCKTLSGSASTCNAECTDIPGCQLCTLGGQCPCAGTQICDRVCRSGSGMDCHRACNPHAYCAAWHGVGSSCDVMTGRCFTSCSVLCASHLVCSGTMCLTPASCDQSPDPDGWCAAMGGGTCVAGKCV